MLCIFLFVFAYLETFYDWPGKMIRFPCIFSSIYLYVFLREYSRPLVHSPHTHCAFPLTKTESGAWDLIPGLPCGHRTPVTLAIPLLPRVLESGARFQSHPKFLCGDTGGILTSRPDICLTVSWCYFVCHILWPCAFIISFFFFFFFSVEYSFLTKIFCGDFHFV